MKKICSKCNVSKEADEFSKLKRSKDGLQAYCKACNRDYAKGRKRKPNSPEVARRGFLKHYYGLTEEQYLAMLEAQGGVCKIRKEDFSSQKNTHIDHDHNCCPSGGRTCGNCIRAILCHNCNMLVGFLEKRKHLLDDAHNYLAGFAS